MSTMQRAGLKRGTLLVENENELTSELIGVR